LKQGKAVECRVDPENRKRVLLVAPEPNQQIDHEVRSLEAPQQASAAATVAAGKPAVGIVKSAELSEILALPGSDGTIWEIGMELRSESERRPWDVTIHQRVPRGAKALLSPGPSSRWAMRSASRAVTSRSTGRARAEVASPRSGGPASMDLAER